MTMRTAPVSVGTTPTRLDVYPDQDSSPGAFDMVVVNEGSSTVRVGGATVAMAGATRGVPLAAGSSLALDGITSDSPVYAICATGTVDVTVLQKGV